jgi:ubiquinone/menaquinone biosynthesis C-methylase UbiE
MSLKGLQDNWDELSKLDPLFAILSWPDKKNNKWDIEDFFQTGVEEIGLILRHLDSLGINVPRRIALDFGCGVGRLTQALATHFEEVHGVDISPTMIDGARKYNRYGDKCKYHLNESNDLRLFSDNSFDLIYTSLTLQHMAPEYSKAYIKEFLRIVSTDGVAVFDLPSKPVKINIIKQLIVRIFGYAVIQACFKVLFRRPAMEMFAIKRENLTKFLEENGAKIIAIERSPSSSNEWIVYQYYVSRK